MNKKTFAYIVFLCMLISCDPRMIYEKNISIPAGEWPDTSCVNIHIPITDTITPANIYLNIRNTGDYPYKNLFLFITTFSPTGYSIRDTFECVLADETGKWHGKGIGDIYSLRIPYRKSVRFPQTGEYTIRIEQAMRTENTLLKGIIDAGIRVESVK